MPGVKTNERPGTRAVLRHYRMSATKARQVLDLIRGEDVDRAADILRGTPREAARVVAKVLASAVANAQHNDGLDPEELYVSACYADEGTTLKRWRPRARGRATRIRKRTCHITVIVSRLPEDRLERRRSRAATAGAQRFRRVAASRRSGAPVEGAAPTETPEGTEASDVGTATAAVEPVSGAGVPETEASPAGQEDVEVSEADQSEVGDVDANDDGPAGAGADGDDGEES